MQVHQQLAGLHEVLGFAAVQAYGFDVRLQARQPQLQHGLRRGGRCKQATSGFVHAHVGGLGRQQHRGKQLKVGAVFELGFRVRVGRL